MPGIIVTPGTSWPVRPLAEITRPLVWPQPRKSLAKRVPDQFQTRWVDNVASVPVIENIYEEYAYSFGQFVLSPGTGVELPAADQIIVDGSRYSDGTHDCTVFFNEYRTVPSGISPVPIIVPFDIRWTTGHTQLPIFKMPEYGTILTGWDSEASSRLSLSTDAKTWPGSPVSAFVIDNEAVYGYHLGIGSANQLVGATWMLADPGDTLRVYHSCGILLQISINYIRDDGWDFDAYPYSIYDSGLSYTAELIHPSLADSMPTTSGPLVNVVMKGMRNGPGNIIIP